MTNALATSNGEQLKETILDSEKAREQAGKTKAAIQYYCARLDATRNAGTLEEHIYRLLGGWQYIDSLYFYPDIIKDVFAAFCNDKVSGPLKEKIGERYFQDFIEMLSRLSDFVKTMDQDNYTAFMLIEDIENTNTAHRHPLKNLIEMDQDYTKIAKPDMLSLVQGTRGY